MANLDTKIKLYLEANSKVYKNELNNFQIEDNSDGNGDFIASWNVSGLAQPTAEQIASYETAGNTAETLHGVLNTRASQYKQLKEQLDLLYHDMTADKGDKTGEWYKHIKAIKDANPKD